MAVKVMTYAEELQELLDELHDQRGWRRRQMCSNEVRKFHEMLCRKFGELIDGEPMTADDIVWTWNEKSPEDEW